MDKIMLIDDDEVLRVGVAAVLEQRGYDVCAVGDGEACLAVLDAEAPDLLLLDVMLPGINGYDLCRLIRERGCKVPVVFLTAKSDIVDKGIGFGAGGDDYVTKPFDAAELVMRIEAHIRRYRDVVGQAFATTLERVAVGDLEVIFGEREVLLRGSRVELTPAEYGILALLARRPGRPYTRSQIQEEIWGEGEGAVKTHSITVLVRRIREKIEENPSDPRRLLTVQGFGYKLSADGGSPSSINHV